MAHTIGPVSLNQSRASMDDIKRELWGPVIREGNLIMLYAKTGIGKTHAAVALSHNLANGTPFLKWACARSKIIYVDGEQGRTPITDRFNEQNKRGDAVLEGNDVQILSFDMFPKKVLPNISNFSEQVYYSEIFKPFDVIVLDNLLTCSGPLNDRDSDIAQWQRIQPWLRKLCAENKTIILVHHSGKNPSVQLGTSLRDNAMDTIMALKELRNEYDESLPGQFTMFFEKHRSFFGEDIQPLHVSFKSGPDGFIWTWERERERLTREIARLRNKNLTIPAIMATLGIGVQVLNALSHENGSNEDGKSENVW